MTTTTPAVAPSATRTTAAVARRPRPRLGLPARRAGGGGVHRLVAVGQPPGQQPAPEHPDQLRLPRPAGRLPDRRERLPPDPAGVRRPRRGPAQHVAPGRRRDRAGDRARHAARRRPPVAELPRAQGRPGVRRVRPQRPAARDHHPDLPRRRAQHVPGAQRRRATVGPLAVISVRGATSRSVRGRQLEVPGGRRRARPHARGWSRVRRRATADRARRGGPHRMVGARHRGGRAGRAVAGARPRGLDAHRRTAVASPVASR